jgi:hypothetical protein
LVILRFSVTTLRLSKWVHPKLVQKLLGHADITTTLPFGVSRLPQEVGIAIGNRHHR